jgi:hypothetical protein
MSVEGVLAVKKVEYTLVNVHREALFNGVDLRLWDKGLGPLRLRAGFFDPDFFGSK